jgi:hemoglobin/transferrin/lactoferrin receptor protein
MLSKRFKFRAIALAITSVLTAPAFAEQSLTQQVILEEKEIERIAVWNTAVNSSSIYLKNETIVNKQADHISDLLRILPGVDVGGAHSLNQRITIRSMDDKDLNISIDGAKQNTYMYHHMGNLQIHADILKSVDIEVGTNSVINGGLGGSVRFETKQAKDLLTESQRFGGRFQASAGDNSGQSYSATVYGVLSDSVDFLSYYNAVNRDNYEVGGSKITNSVGDTIVGTDGTVRGLEGEVNDALIKFGWEPAANQRIQLSYEKYTDEGNYSYRPDMGLATDLAITNSLEVPLLWPTEFTRDTLTINYEINFGSTFLKAAAYSNTSELWRDETGYAESAAFSSWAAVVRGEAKNTGMNLIAETSFDRAGNHDLTYGFDYIKHDTLYNAVYESTVDKSSEEVNNIALFVQDRILLSEMITLVPGVRYDNYDIQSKVVNKTYSNTAFALALELQSNNDLLFKLSATEVFKGPEIGEVFGGAGLFDTANEDIKAETGINYELAIAYQLSIMNGGNLSLGATIFKTSINDYVYDYATAPEDIGGSWKDNIGDMEIEGFETYVNYQQGQFSGAITYSSAESELSAYENYSDLDGARLDRQQGDSLSVTAGYTINNLGLSLNWEVLLVDDVSADIDLDGATLDNSKDEYTVHNINASWSPESIDGLTLIVGVDNIFDEYYSSQSSRTGVSFHPRFGELYLQDFEPGRNIKGTIAYYF